MQQCAECLSLEHGAFHPKTCSFQVPTVQGKMAVVNPREPKTVGTKAKRSGVLNRFVLMLNAKTFLVRNSHVWASRLVLAAVGVDQFNSNVSLPRVLFAFSGADCSFGSVEFGCSNFANMQYLMVIATSLPVWSSLIKAVVQGRLCSSLLLPPCSTSSLCGEAFDSGNDWMNIFK